VAANMADRASASAAAAQEAAEQSQLETKVDGTNDQEEEEKQIIEAPAVAGGRSFEQVSDLVLELQASHKREVEELQQEQQREIKELKRQLAEAQRQSKSESPAGTEPVVDSLAYSSVEQQKQQFIKFVTGALKGKDSPEYKQLYHFLLKCFTDSDNNFDGRIGFLEFEMLIEIAASLPRRFGYAPSTPELYKTDSERLSTRRVLYNTLRSAPAGSSTTWQVKDSNDFVSFSTWLEYVLGHIKEKAAQLRDVDKRSPWDSTKEEFRNFVICAARSRQTQEFKQFYYFVLKCFTDADNDMDGRIDAQQFDRVIDIAAAAPRRWGLAPTTSDMYANDKERIEARTTIFRSLDKKGTGFIEFDTWLEYIYEHICAKVTAMGEVTTMPSPAFNAARSGMSSYSSCPFAP